MSHTFFDRNQNLQIHGDVNIVSGSGPTHNDPTFVHVSQKVQATKAQSQVIERGFKLLCDNTAASALYASGTLFAGPQCHPETRIAVQDYIFRWLDDPDGQIAMWMHGPVGIGKSAIAQTVAHHAAEREQLSSAFFFFRSDDTRNSAKHLVPTLAYEMTQQMPHTLNGVCQTIGGNPLLLSSPLDRQISRTLLQPLSTPSDSSPRGCMLIVIDGLDECLDTNTQQAIIRSFILSLLGVAGETIHHKILIVSRPETHITSAVLAADINPHVKYLALESWKTADDIGIFLRSKLTEIRQTHPLRHYLPSVWPTNASFRKLRQRSVGSFAYASVAIRYLASHNNNPEHTLQDLLLVLPNRAAAAFADLDALYRHILLSLDEEMSFILRKVLCLYVYSFEDELDGLAARLSEDKSRVELALLHVTSLIQLSESCGSQCISIHHTSFGEFLCDKERSGDLYVFSPNIASAVAQALSSLWLHPLSDVTEYSWFHHISTVMSDDYPFGLYSGRKINLGMYVHIISALVATKIPSSFLHPLARTWETSYDLISAYKSVIAFIKVLLEVRDNRHLDSTHKALFNSAYDVICTWLRSHFNLFFHNAPTPNDVLDILLEYWPNKMGIARGRYPFLAVLYGLREEELFYCVLRVFPDVDRDQIFSVILHRYLVSPFCTCKPYTAYSVMALTMAGLYNIVLNSGEQIPSFCQKLEPLILMGQKAFGGVPSTPRDCIFRLLYGDKCYLDSEYKLVLADEKVSTVIPNYSWFNKKSHCRELANEIDCYIREAHRKHQFAYISEDIENLYRTSPPVNFLDWYRDEFWDNHELEEL